MGNHCRRADAGDLLSAGTILTGADPAGVITLMRAGQYRYAAAPAAVTYDGYVWAALDFVCDETSGPLSPLQLSIAGPPILARQVPGATVDILRISGDTLLYSAQALTSESHGIQNGEFTALLSYHGFAATSDEMPTYLPDLYHGLRRYEDPGMPFDDGGWKTPVARKRHGIPAILRAARLGVTCNPVLSVFRPFKRRLRGQKKTPAQSAWPDARLDNLPKMGSRIPQRYGRAVFAPDIAHPPYWIGSGSTVTRARLFCLGVGKYKIHRVWVGQTLAWENGSSTGNVAGFSITQLDPGAAILPSDFDTGKISIFGGPNVTAKFTTTDYSLSSDSVSKSITFLRPTAPITDDNAVVQNVPTTSSISIPDQWMYVTKSYLPNIAGFVRYSDGDTIYLMGAVPDLDANKYTITINDAPGIRTRIETGSISVTGRRTGGIGSAQIFNLVTWDYTVDSGSLGVSQLNNISGTTSYSTTTVPQNTPGSKIILLQTINDAVVANLALVPVYAPAVGHSEASHLVVKYTANTDYDSAPITVEASRLVIDPGAGTEIPHSNAAVCAYDVAARAVGAENVDAAAFVALAQSDDVINVSCGGMSEQYADVWDLLVSVLRTINAVPVYVGGLLSCVADTPAPARWLFTPASIARGTVSLAETDRPASSTPDRNVIEFIDKLNGAKTEAAYTLPGTIGNNEAREILEFVGDAGQALVVARYMLGAARYIKSVVQVGVGLEALTMRIGDRVHIAHPEYGLGDYSGVVDGAITWTETTVTHPSYVLFRRADGSVWGPVLADVEQVAYRGGTVPRIVRVDPTSRAAVDAAQGTLASVIAEYPVLRMEWGAFATAPPRWIVAETQGNSITLVSSAGETAQLY